MAIYVTPQEAVALGNIYTTKKLTSKDLKSLPKKLCRMARNLAKV